MHRLTPAQPATVTPLVDRLAAICGGQAVVLAGSHAHRRALPGSAVALGLLYSEADPFSIADIRALAAEVHATGTPVVADSIGWGRWVNSGASLTIRGQRVDLLYRSLEHVERVIDEADAGHSTPSNHRSGSSAATTSARSRQWPPAGAEGGRGGDLGTGTELVRGLPAPCEARRAGRQSPSGPSKACNRPR